VSAGTVITATATDPNGNTSEFAQCEMAPGCTVAGLAPRITGIEVFYNGRHGDAADPSKSFIAVGQASAAGNVSNYAGGITGIRVVFNQLVTFLGGTAAAFSFEATPENTASTTFTPFVPPTPPVFTTSFFGFTTTVDITFGDGEVQQRWLRTTVNALFVSGAGQMLNGELPPPLTFPSGDIAAGGDAEFIIGSLPCDVNADFVVNFPGDVVPVMTAGVPGTSLPIDNVLDVDKSGVIDSTDGTVTTVFVDPAYFLPALP